MPRALPPLVGRRVRAGSVNRLGSEGPGVVLFDVLREPTGTPRWSGPVLKCTLFSLFLTPAIPTAAGFPAVRLEDLILFGSAAILSGTWLLGAEEKVAWGTRQTLLCGFAVFVPASIVAGAIMGYPAAFGDLNQWIRLAKYVLIYTLAATYIWVGGSSARKRQTLLDFVVACSVALAFVAVQQFFDLFGLNSLYVSFVAPTQFETLLEGGGIPRPVGMAGNPNELGFLFALGSLAAVYQLITNGKRRYWIALGVQVAGLALTLSRSAVLALAGGITLLLLVSGVMRKWLMITRVSRTLGSLSLVIVALLVVAWQTGFLSEATLRFAGMLDPMETSAWRIRLDHWQENISLFFESPILGVGPLRQTEFIQYAADNEFLLMLRTYGLVGTLYLSAVFVLPQLRVFRHETKVGLAVERATLFAHCVLVACAIYMFPAAVYHSLVLMPVALVLLAACDWTVRSYTVGVWS